MDKSSVWARVDNRLVHGQVIETWLPYSHAHTLIVCHDGLAQDELQQEIICLAVPRGVRILFSRVPQILHTLRSCCEPCHGNEVFVLFASCTDARRAFESGLTFRSLNIGNLHYTPGKEQVCDHIAVDKEDVNCLRFFKNKGIKLDFRCVPNKQVQVKTLW